MSEPTAVIFRLAEGAESGTITQWFVAEGEVVAEAQPLVEIEADKTTVELLAPCSGTVLKIERPDGATLHDGDVLGWLGEARSQATLPLQLCVHGSCPSCGSTVAVNGPWSSAACMRCGHQASLAPAWWSDVFTRVARGKVVFRLDRDGWRVTVAGSKDVPSCHNCRAALPVDVDTPMHQIRCGGCGLVHDCRPAPAWLTELDPTAVRVVGDLPPPEASVPTQCPHCHASVHPHTRVPTPRCPQCGRDIENPAQPPMPRPWSVLRRVR